MFEICLRKYRPKQALKKKPLWFGIPDSQLFSWSPRILLSDTMFHFTMVMLNSHGGMCGICLVNQPLKDQILKTMFARVCIMTAQMLKFAITRISTTSLILVFNLFIGLSFSTLLIIQLATLFLDRNGDHLTIQANPNICALWGKKWLFYSLYTR